MGVLTKPVRGFTDKKYSNVWVWDGDLKNCVAGFIVMVVVFLFTLLVSSICKCQSFFFLFGYILMIKKLSLVEEAHIPFACIWGE